MGYRVNAKDITTNYTQTLAEFTANLKYEDLSLIHISEPTRP